LPKGKGSGIIYPYYFKRMKVLKSKEKEEKEK